MRVALLIAVPIGAFLTLIVWRLSELLSPDAVALVLGLAVGVLAGIPPMALVAMARRRDEQDDYIDVQPTYLGEVTPYSRIARRAAGMPALPDRQAEIDTLRAALAYLESEAQ